jgi:hypothetical protein
LLILASIEWAFTAFAILQERMQSHSPFLRATIIFLGVGAWTLLSAALLQASAVLKRYPHLES